MSRTAAIALVGLIAFGAGATLGGAEVRAPPEEPARVFVRFQLLEPAGTRYYVRLGGYIHKEPWHLPGAVVPPGSDADPGRRVASGDRTPWFDLSAHAGDLLHGRLARAGGVAEFPNVTAEFVADEPSEKRRIEIELATGPDEASVAKRFRESFSGASTSFLVSPRLREDAASLETASEMSQRRLSWAREATGGRRVAPRRLIVQTSFWAPQRPELNLIEAEVLHLLGFNVVGNQTPEVRERYGFLEPGATHDVDFGPAATREAIDRGMARLAAARPQRFAPGAPFNFSDEVCARPPIGEDPVALAHFRAWLAERAQGFGELDPIETPEELREREKRDARAARRAFAFASRFRQEAAIERIAWTSESFHRHFGPEALTSILVADHPYFAGTGLGMGMEPNWAWGGYPLALDWFLLGRRRAVDLIGIEDWMGLQFMYGPDSTWEGFQLMGFQAAIFRSASRGETPIIAWITPSDERNLRLKSASALSQGAKHVYYWTYGPTATSTENYWSDLRGAYDGVAKIARQLAAAEEIIAEGRLRKTEVALLYSVSSDLWQPFGYVHMLERRGLYFALVHEQHAVDLISEEDVEAGRLEAYRVLYTADPSISAKAAEAIARWVRAGGLLYATCAAGTLDEFGEPSAALAEVFGIEPAVSVSVQPGRYGVRCGVNGIPYADEVVVEDPGGRLPSGRFGAIGAKVSFRPRGARTIARFSDGAPAAAIHEFGKGEAIAIGACPGIAYVKEARFVPRDLAEKWSPEIRALIAGSARSLSRPVALSEPVVEAGVYDSPRGTALVLANFTYERIPALGARLPLPRRPRSVRSAERGEIAFEVAERPGDRDFPWEARFRLDLDWNDVVLAE